MKFSWKSRLLTILQVMILIAATTGCGGFAASRSVSPASFFMPGLLRVEPPAPPKEFPAPPPATTKQVAQN
jgi:hypothetical protein